MFSELCNRNVDLMENWRFVTFWPLTKISFSPYSKLHRESTTFSQPATRSEKIEKVADTMRMFSPRRKSRCAPRLFHPNRQIFHPKCAPRLIHLNQSNISLQIMCPEIDPSKPVKYFTPNNVPRRSSDPPVTYFTARAFTPNVPRD